MSGMIVYQVMHQCHDDETGENGLNCGFFSSLEKCREAVEHLVTQPGFRDYPDDFKFLEFPLDTIVSPDRFRAKGSLSSSMSPVDPAKLQHMWYATADDEYLDFAVTIGVFSSEDQCRRVIDLLAKEPEFSDHPSGFDFCTAAFDLVCWEEGFFSEPIEGGTVNLPAWLLKK
jgi:hypothetical protein